MFVVVKMLELAFAEVEKTKRPVVILKASDKAREDYS